MTFKAGDIVKVASGDKRYDGRLGRILSIFGGLAKVQIDNRLVMVFSDHMQRVRIKKDTTTWNNCVWQPEGLKQ